MESFLWNLQLEEYIATMDQSIEIEPEFIKYYQHLTEEGNQLVEQINPDTLAANLPKLMAIDEKCTLVIFYILNGSALEDGDAVNTIQVIEQEYKKTHREKYIFDLPEYEEWSISQRIM
ncbi:DUF7006 family protein [Candidatus Enterococcus mansonii]|uniref:Uncharacterized protein n=1 Tax=Candidatus Enterococcus mansonii TaxID=1834181 RepID=A0A242CGX9_9ENTE|nr:hypothetical protein [Enterococcus sp. 4G2_DIV0659]OTO09504.1 hypothetical protein A5880_000183 [Enterococcus sp. 4G2_DIV0659]